MVFKGRFFSSKKSDSSSPDGSNSPRTLGTKSPIRSDKKKPKPASKLDDSTAAAAPSSGFASPCRQTQVKDGQRKKDSKGKEPEKPNQAQTPLTHNPVSIKSGSSLGSKSKKATAAAAATNPVEEKEAPSSVSPILASSLGLNRIKTRSGPLPQESFFGFRGEKGSGLGASNLSRPGGNGGDRSSGSANSGSGSGGKKKDMEFAPSRMGVPPDNAGLGNWVENGTNSDGVSPGSVPSRDRSPNLAAASSLANAESSSGAGIHLVKFVLVILILHFFIYGFCNYVLAAALR